jgi:uncharacterized protein DUF6790
MSSIVRATIEFTIANYAITFFCAGLISALLSIMRMRRVPERSVAVETLIGWHVFWSIGVSYLVNFVFHAFFGGLAARFIGWAESPFQFEVATASLGFAAVGFIAAWHSFDLRLAAVLGPALFTLGAATGHVYQMATAHNFAPGNAGPIFYADIVVPLFGFALLWRARPSAGAHAPDDAGVLDVRHPSLKPQTIG